MCETVGPVPQLHHCRLRNAVLLAFQRHLALRAFQGRRSVVTLQVQGSCGQFYRSSTRFGARDLHCGNSQRTQLRSTLDILTYLHGFDRECQDPPYEYSPDFKTWVRRRQGRRPSCGALHGGHQRCATAADGLKPLLLLDTVG